MLEEAVIEVDDATAGSEPPKDKDAASVETAKSLKNKKKRAKAKAKKQETDQPAEAGSSSTTDPAAGISADISKLLQQVSVRSAAKKEEHRFWDTQPVPKIGEQVEVNHQLDVVKTTDDVRQTPYPLPPGFEWSPLDAKDTHQLDELYHLLTENYVEDDDNMFRFDYSRDFLQWALLSPGYNP